MLKYLVETSEFGIPVLKVTYADSAIELDLIDMYKDQSNLYTLYNVINDYIVTLSPFTQKEIFDIFNKVATAEYRNHCTDPGYVMRLENNIAKACDLLNYDNFKIWLRTREHEILIPENVQSAFQHDPDMNTTIEKTYIRNEYRDLIGLILFIRALSPLYIDFYNQIKNVTSHYYYKLFMLFVRSSLYVSPEIEKLKLYIEVNQQTLMGTSKNEHLIISAGLSDDDILDSLVSEIIFNKLLTIDFFNKKCNIISFIFQTIRYKGSFATSDSCAIRGKSSISDPNKEDISYFEDYRKTSRVPIGVAVEIQDAMSKIDMLLSGLQITNFNFELYQNELDNIRPFMENRFSKIQTFMLGWYLRPVINPRALFYLEYKKIVELMLFTKVALIETEHKFIATFLSSVRSDNNNYVNVVIKNALNRNLIKQITEHYTFAFEEDKQSIVEKTITESAKEIVNNIWVPINPLPEMRPYINSANFLDVPGNVNDIVCSFVEHTLRIQN